MWKNPALSQPFPISEKCDFSQKARKNFWGLKYKKKFKKLAWYSPKVSLCGARSKMEHLSI